VTGTSLVIEVCSTHGDRFLSFCADQTSIVRRHDPARSGTKPTLGGR
jgi:hypothetical protein